MATMKVLVCTLKLPDGKTIVAKMPADASDDEPVEIEWSGAIDRLGKLILEKHPPGFLQRFLQARALELQAEVELKFEDKPTSG